MVNFYWIVSVNVNSDLDKCFPELFGPYNSIEETKANKPTNYKYTTVIATDQEEGPFNFEQTE